MITHLKDHRYYEDCYDKVTVDEGRRNVQMYRDIRDRFFEKSKDEDPDSYLWTFWFSRLVSLLVEMPAAERWEKREQTITEWMNTDKAKDHQIEIARLGLEPACEHCGAIGLRLIDKYLMRHSVNDSYIDAQEEVLFMLSCPSCKKKTAVWQDGTIWETQKTHCQNCNAVMDEKVTEGKRYIVTTLTCPSCNNTVESRIDMNRTREVEDPNFENDRKLYCLDEKRALQMIDWKRRLLEAKGLLDEEIEREDKKEVYTAAAQINKLKIPQLIDTLRPIIEKANYREVVFDRPEIIRNVIVGFSCLDNDSGREDSKSRKVLKKVIVAALKDTNWRLTSDGMSYRLGYLSGRLRAYESETELVELVEHDKSKQSE